LNVLRVPRGRLDAQIGPRGRYQRTGSIRQHQRQLQLATAVAPAQHSQRRSLKRMASTDDRYLIGIAIEVTAVVVGSLSSGLSTMSGMIGCWRKWLSAWTMPPCCTC
jgi:hypothetical protein